MGLRLTTSSQATVVSVSLDSASLASTQSPANAEQRSHRGLVILLAGITRVDALPTVPCRGVNEGEHGLIEVDPAQPLDSLGGGRQLPAGLGAAQDRGVERAAAEVVDGDDVAGVEPFGRAVRSRRRTRQRPAARSSVKPGTAQPRRPSGWPATDIRSCTDPSLPGG